MKTIEFWFDFASTYSYPSAMRIEELATAHKLSVSWKPFLLGPIFNAQGWNDSPFNIYPVKGEYMWRDMERLCERQALPLNMPSLFPQNGLLAARAALRFSCERWMPEFVRQIYRANFVEGMDISQTDTVATCLESVGASPIECIAQAQTPESKAALRAQTDKAIELRIFGAPSFVVDGELFWGNDRLEHAIEWASR